MAVGVAAFSVAGKGKQETGEAWPRAHNVSSVRGSNGEAVLSSFHSTCSVPSPSLICLSIAINIEVEGRLLHTCDHGVLLKFSHSGILSAQAVLRRVSFTYSREGLPRLQRDCPAISSGIHRGEMS